MKFGETESDIQARIEQYYKNFSSALKILNDAINNTLNNELKILSIVLKTLKNASKTKKNKLEEG